MTTAQTLIVSTAGKGTVDHLVPEGTATTLCGRGTLRNPHHMEIGFHGYYEESTRKLVPYFAYDGTQAVCSRCKKLA